MNRDKFKPRTMPETFSLLCYARGGDLLRGGKPNQSEVARRAGTSQSNISRWLAEANNASDDSIKLLAAAFKISPAQMRGEAPINGLDVYDQNSPDKSEFSGLIDSLPEEFQNQIRQTILFYAQLNDKNKDNP